MNRKFEKWLLLSSLLIAASAPLRAAPPLSMADRQYVGAFNENVDQMHLAMQSYYTLTGEPVFLNWKWRSDKPWMIKFADALTTFHLCDQAAKQLRPTSRFRGSCALYQNALDEYDYDYRRMPAAMGSNDMAAILLCVHHMKLGEADIKKSLTLFKQTTNQ